MNKSDELQPRWLKISIKVDPALVDALSDFLVGVTGAEVEIAVDDKRPLVTLNAFVEKKVDDESQCVDVLQQISDYVSELATIFKVPVPKIESSVIEDQDWANTWKEFFKPFAIIPGLVIKPTWEDYRVTGDERVIEMDPGMAFGTGHHATTTMALELLQSALRQHDEANILDVGTGTGILGIASVLFGAKSVLGIDNDPEAVSAASDNVWRNGMTEKMSVSSAGIEELQKPFSVVVANIIHDVLVELADDLVRLTAKGGKLVLSGILTGEQSENIKQLFSNKGLLLTDDIQKKEWSALLFAK